MITIRHSHERGHANLGWLNTKHTFSFGGYYDPTQMGFSALRVINDDVIQPGTGFDTHGHSNMEIISYVLEGAIEHRDSEGNSKILPAGEFQLMSAGKGIRHSEYNASITEPVHILQIWIEPNVFDGKPGYQQKYFGSESGLTTIATPNGDNNTLQIKQDAKLHQLILESASEFKLDIEPGRRVFIQLVKGELQLDADSLTPGDGAKIEQQTELRLKNSGEEQVIALVFDLP